MAPTPEPIDMANKYKEIVKANGFHEPVAEVIIKDSGLVGENFGSKTQVVTIKFKNPNVKPLNLFTKGLIDSENHIKFILEVKAFEKEATFFTKYVPAAAEYCKKYGREDLMSIYPKCYYGDDSLIVFENLVIDKGFVLLDKETCQDFEAAKCSITNYAKHHAISYSLMQSMGGPEHFYEQFKNLDYEAFYQAGPQKMMNKAMEESISRNIEILENTKIDGKEKALRLLKAASGTAVQSFVSTLEISEEDRKILALNHGDAHTNNMMFQKDKETGKIQGQVLIDFQVTRCASPCADLQYYIFTSVQAPVRRERLHDLLRIYLDTFNKTCASLGYPLDLSFEEFLKSFRRKAKIGFCMGMMMNNGLAFKAMKTVDPAEVDFQDFGAVIDRYIRKVLKEKPEEAVNVAKDIIDFMEEYSNMSLEAL